MRYKWLKKTKNNDKIIIFFNGWGMDEFIVSGLECGEYDVVVLYDYNDLDLDISFGEYSEKHVIGWSMGVMISSLFRFDGVKSRTALCGTPFPIDDVYGIPKRIYDLTIKGFSEKSVEKFMKKMGKKYENFDKFSDRILENQKSELLALKGYVADEDCKFTKVFVPENDFIIPTKNQLNYWEKYGVELIKIPEGHCPFCYFKSWAEILGL